MLEKGDARCVGVSLIFSGQRRGGRVAVVPIVSAFFYGLSGGLVAIAAIQFRDETHGLLSTPSRIVSGVFLS